MKSHTNELLALQPHHAFFVGIDSDGCVFPTMEIKQKRCFHPELIRQWGLESVAAAVREVAGFVSLNSVHRGRNRFPSLLLTFELLRDHPEVRAAGAAARLPACEALRGFVNSGRPLGNDELQRLVDRTGDPELRAVLEWSKAVNARIEREANAIAPYPSAVEALGKIQACADSMVVSQTPTATLVREWERHGLRERVRFIAGQEYGTKTEQMRLATQNRFPPARLLLIGDAPADREAVEALGGLFYPILPGDESTSWRRFCAEALARFLNGSFTGAYARALDCAFRACLPESPPWKR